MKEKRLLILDNTVGDYYRPMERFTQDTFSMPADSVNLYKGEQVENLGLYTHIIATGCTKSICDIEPWMSKLADLLQEALERDLNILSICFSHQMLARTVAGKDYVRRRKAPEFGWVEQEVLEDDPIFGHKGDKIWGFVSHFDEVTENLPKNQCTVILKSHTCRVEAFRVNGKRAWGVQGHFEESPETGNAMLKKICEADSSYAQWVQNWKKPRDDGYWNRILERFQSL